MRWFAVLGLSVRLFCSPFDWVEPSSPEEIRSLTGDLLIDGFVSVSSGQISLSETDLHVKGAQDLLLKRTYIPPQILGRYENKEKADRLRLGKALRQLEARGWVVLPHLWAGYNLNSNYFQVRDVQGFVLEFEIHGNKGILKTSSYGCSNLRGEEPSSAADVRNISLLIEGDLVKITWPDGTRRHYSRQNALVFRLEREFLPNGKAVLYEYNGQRLSKISSSDPTGKQIYASISRVNENQYIGSDGREVNLYYESREIKGKKKHSHYEEIATLQFPVMTVASTPAYTNTVGYNERTLLSSYDAKSYPISCSYYQIKNVPSRIQTFSTPSGSTSFAYDPAIAGEKGGSTTVDYANGAKTIYRFNKLLLLEAIENWLDGNLINQKLFEYDVNQHIKSIQTRDGKSKLLIAKRFQCDSAGNPTLETIEGDFGIFSIRRRFDNNRLVFEDRDDGLQYETTYLGDTWLITSKTTLDSGKKIRKTIYHYDSANNLIEREEEGKTRTRFTLYPSSPHLHRVEWEEKTDWDGQPIHKTRFSYDQWGNIALEQHFGSDDNLAYTIERTYNSKGELLSEKNPLNETALYRYDERGRCIYEEPVSNGLVINRTFDPKGRLSLLSESGRETRFEYNNRDKLIAKTDDLGYRTTYHYHPVHGKPDLIQEPPSTTRIAYDAFGREAERVDAYGATIQKDYNGYGNPIKIAHPNGGIETFTYDSNGRLTGHIDPDGLETSYFHDALGRVTKKAIGQHAKTFLYDNYNLIQVTDPEGHTTTYQYDLENRKIQENRNGRITRYGYDPLGYLAWEKRGDRTLHLVHDALGRLRKESIDGLLNTTWDYDAGGNVTAIERGGTTTFDYDAHNRLIQTVDPEGHSTTIAYEKGPRLLRKKILSPLGIETLETYNPQGQLLTKEIDGKLVERNEYDHALRLSKQDHLTIGYTLNGKKQSMNEADVRETLWTYTPGDRVRTLQKPDGTTIRHEYDTQQRLIRADNRTFLYDKLDRIIGGSGFFRTLDAFGNITREEWDNGLWIETDYDDWDRPLERRLPDQSRILYHYEGPFLKKVTRTDENGKERYSHLYDHYDANGNPLVEHGLISTTYGYDKAGRIISQNNPYYSETIEYDPAGNLVRKGGTAYTYDTLSQMTSELGAFTANYDARYNLTEYNGQPIYTNALNQIQGFSYDPNGNLLKPGFVYDKFNQLIEAAGEKHVYDALGRRLWKGKTAFFYIGDEEIGAFEQSSLKELKIPGRSPIAIEIDNKPYAPITDVQGTIRHLVDPAIAKISASNCCDAFGAGLSTKIPYAYAGKRYDPQTGLIYFGSRYYDPTLRRWLTPDPLGPIDHSNLYQYVFNNPFRYQDPKGESVFGFLCGVGQIILGGTIMVSGVGLEIVTLGGYTFAIGFHEAAGLAIMTSGCAQAMYNAKDITFNKHSSTTWKNTNVYVPDRPLPNDKDGMHLPDTDAPHTQLGTREGRKGKHPQAREFDSNGNPIRDIDFTDHCRPHNHPNPHQHEHLPNPTGGTPKRDPVGKPVPEWNYL